MAAKKITELSAITEVANEDLLMGVDVSDTTASVDGTNKKFTKASFIQGIVPVGTIVMHGGDTVPVGWLECDGTNVSRTTFADLFGVVGTDYGVGDGSTTFGLPEIASTSTTLSYYVIKY